MPRKKPYTGPSIRINPDALGDSVTTSTSSSSSMYAERLKNKFNLGIPGRANRTAASDAASDYVPRAESPARRTSRIAGEDASEVRKILGPGDLSSRPTTSRTMTPSQTRTLLGRRGQLRSLETRGVVPEPGTRSAGRPTKVNRGGRPVGTGYGGLVNHRQVAAAADASAAASRARGLSGRGIIPNAHNAGGYRGMTKDSYKRADSARRKAATGGVPGRVTRFAGDRGGVGVGQLRIPGGGLMGMPAPAASSGMNAPVVPAMKANPSLIGQLGQIQAGGYAGVVGETVRGVQAETREARRPMRREMIQRAKNNAAYTGARRGTTGAAAGAGAGVLDEAIRDSPGAGARAAIERTGKKGFLRSGKGLAIGAGAAVIAGLAYSGRRGEGSSGGRTSMSRY